VSKSMKFKLRHYRKESRSCVRPAALAGRKTKRLVDANPVVPEKVECQRVAWFSNFSLKALVNRASRRIDDASVHVGGRFSPLGPRGIFAKFRLR
jgi:hypothetical protein